MKANTIRVGRRVRLLTGVLLLLAGTAAGAGVGGTFYTGTTLSYNYAGALNGSFFAEGSVADISGFPPALGSAAVGFVIDAGDSTYFMANGGIRNPDETVDWTIVIIAVEGDLVPGTYNMSNAVVAMAFFDDAENVVIDESGEIPVEIVAENTFIGTGSVVISSVGQTVEATFSGMLADPDNFLRILNVSGGNIDLSGAVVPVREKSWGRIKALY